jgi:peptidyl-prolyl cis-trans isomerase D
MFQFFRRRDTAVRVFLGGLLVLICVMLVVTLIPGLTGSSPSGESVLAKVDGESITSVELARQLQQWARSQRLPPSLIPVYAPQVLAQMVRERLTLQEAQRLGLSVSGQELANELRGNQQIFPGGQYVGEDQYRALVESRFGLSVPQFEEKMKEALLLHKLRRLVTAGASVSDQDIASEFHRRNDKMRVAFAALKATDLKSGISVSDAEIADFLNKNRSRYQIPERRQFKLVFINTAKLKETVPVTEQDLQRYYNDNKDRFRVEDRVKVSHTLFKTAGKAAEEIEATRKKAEEVLKRARAGEDFAKLAKENSDDAQTTAKGGDLGWIVRGQTVSEFEQAAFSLPVGTISDLIKTVYGFHILKIEAREKARLRTLQEVAAEITPQARAEKASRLTDELANKAETAMKRNPDSIPAVAAALNLPVLETGLIKRGDPLPEAGAEPAADDNLFTPNLKPGRMTSLLAVANGLLIASPVQISDAHPAELSEVRDRVENDLRNEKAAATAATRIRELAELARKGGDLKKAAGAVKISVKESESFSRDGNIKDLGAASSLGERAFSMNPGEIGGPVDVTDGQAVFQVLDKQPAAEEELTKSRDGLRKELIEQKQNLLYQVFGEALKERASRQGRLRIDQAALDRLTNSYER